MVRRALSLFIVLALLTAGCAGPVGERMKQGALTGAAVGALGGFGVGKSGEAAALGAAIGAVAGAIGGAIVGTSEAKAASQAPQPLAWLKVTEGAPRKRVVVLPTSAFGHYGVDVAIPVVEEQIMLRGAAVFKPVPAALPGGYHPDPQQAVAGADYVVQVAIYEQYGAVTIGLQVIDPGSRIVANATSQAFVGYSASVYGTGDVRIDAIRNAAKQAVWRLH